LGDLADETVIVGGLVPSLLIDQNEVGGADGRHVGTLDLDVGLALAILDDQRYQALTERLRQAVPGTLPLALTAGFYDDEAKRRQWRAFCSRGAVTDRALEDVVTTLSPFLGPALAAAHEPTSFRTTWSPPGPWAPVNP